MKILSDLAWRKWHSTYLMVQNRFIKTLWRHKKLYNCFLRSDASTIELPPGELPARRLDRRILTPVLTVMIFGALDVSARAEFRYINKVAKSKQMVIFVHGLWGDPEKSFEPSNYFGRKTGPSWMELMRDDHVSVREQDALSKYSTATLGYPAGYSGKLSTHQAANNLLTELYDSGILDDANMRISFIAHSLGGLVIKAMFLSGEMKKRELLAAKTNAVFLLATPKKGAPLADIVVSLLPQIIRGRIVVDLMTDNSYLQDLHDRWREFLKQTDRSRRFSVFCAYETEDVVGIPGVSGIRPVPEVYADTDCDERARPATGHDHISIAKPAEILSDNIYGWVRGRLADTSDLYQTDQIRQPVPHVPAPRTSLPPEMPFVATRALVEEAQRLLFELNYDVGDIDGLIGDETHNAILAFEADAKLIQNNGKLTQATLDALRAAKSLAPWGAIVYSRISNKWGASWNHRSRKDAISEAIKSCGVPSCTTRFSFFGKDCAAMANSSVKLSITSDDTVAEASRTALDRCKTFNDSCAVTIAFCANGEGAPDNN
jgi:hypothetical protein